MTTVLVAAAGALIGYLLGSIPSGLLVGRMSGVRDVRDSGSGKTGFTNSLRVMGVRWSLLVLAVDVGKGAAAVLIGRYLLDDPWAAALAGLFAVVGHQFPVFAGFRGGRGVATIYGAFAAMVPIAAIPIGLFGVLVLVIWRYASLMSVLSAAAGLAALVLLIVIGEAAQEYLVFGLLAVAAVEISHLGNIRRLIAGTEPKIGQGGDRRTRSGA
jgi:glycerol-3-phosphate acyltransferase PlsY